MEIGTLLVTKADGVIFDTVIDEPTTFGFYLSKNQVWEVIGHEEDTEKYCIACKTHGLALRLTIDELLEMFEEKND